MHKLQKWGMYGLTLEVFSIMIQIKQVFLERELSSYKQVTNNLSISQCKDNHRNFYVYENEKFE